MRLGCLWDAQTNLTCHLCVDRAGALTDLRDLMPSEFPSTAERLPYEGPVFKTPFAFNAPNAMPICEESNQNTKGTPCCPLIFVHAKRACG